MSIALEGQLVDILLQGVLLVVVVLLLDLLVDDGHLVQVLHTCLEGVCHVAGLECVRHGEPKCFPL